MCSVTSRGPSYWRMLRWLQLWAVVESALAFGGSSVGLRRQLRGYKDLLSVTKWNERPGQRFAQRVNRVVASRFQNVPVQGWKGPIIHQWQCDVSEQSGSRQGAQSPGSVNMS